MKLSTVSEVRISANTIIMSNFTVYFFIELVIGN